ncbi:hypothetical protein CP973_08150 [Streptomyces albofaciens JCM 4342]|nr:hypothetical protein CP973_08150 [Streptomyces albofaciens JCM 4342]
MRAPPPTRPAARKNRPRPMTEAPARIPDSKVFQLAALLDHSGALALLDAELVGHSGPGACRSGRC